MAASEFMKNCLLLFFTGKIYINVSVFVYLRQEDRKYFSRIFNAAENIFNFCKIIFIKVIASILNTNV